MGGSQFRESPIFFFSSPFSSIFSLKPWKLRGKAVSLPTNSLKKEIMGHQEDIVKQKVKSLSSGIRKSSLTEMLRNYME